MSHETRLSDDPRPARGGLKAALVEALWQHKHRRGLGRAIGRKPGGGSAIVPESLRSLHRPEEADARLVPGHWRGHLLKGASNRSSDGTLVERMTRFVTLAKMDCNGAAALEGFTRPIVRQDRGPSPAAQACRTLPGFLRRSLTPGQARGRLYDHGVEMACHPELARRLKIDICISRSPRAVAARIEREHQRPLGPGPREPTSVSSPSATSTTSRSS